MQQPKYSDRDENRTNVLKSLAKNPYRNCQTDMNLTYEKNEEN